MKVIWTDKALNKLEEIAEYIALDNENTASKWVANVLKQTKNLKDFPNIGRKSIEQNNETVREIIHGNYRIVYQIKEKQINILMIRNFKENKVL